MDLRITTARLTRTLVCAGLVLGLLHLAHADDFFSSVTRPAALALLHAVGQTASDRGDCLVVGALLVPWSRDCAGLNLLAVLWAMILWTNVGESSTTRAWLRLALAVPAAIVANVARVLTIIGYRLALVPAVESPQLHYFIGFLWLMPCVGLFIPRGGRSLGCYLLETLHLAAALSLLAPLVPGPGGSFAALSALVLLSQNKFLQRQSSALIAVGALWLLAGAFIAWASMESLWLPWLLACPWFTSTGVLVRRGGVVLLAGCVPLLAMRWEVQVMLAVVLGWNVFLLMRCVRMTGGCMAASTPQPSARSGWGFSKPALALLFLLPFIASSTNAAFIEHQPPPAGVMAQKLDANSHRVTLVGQPRDVALTWFGPWGRGRHHTLTMCMRFRGVELQPSATHPEVFSDGRMWMREFFLHEGMLLTSYGDYLRHTFAPGSSAGVHLILSAPMDAMDAGAFTQTSVRLAAQLSDMVATDRTRQ